MTKGYRYVRVKTENMTIEAILKLLGEDFLFLDFDCDELKEEEIGNYFSKAKLSEIRIMESFEDLKDYEWQFVEDEEYEYFYFIYKKQEQKILKGYYILREGINLGDIPDRYENWVNIGEMKYYEIQKLIGKKFKVVGKEEAWELRRVYGSFLPFELSNDQSSEIMNVIYIGEIEGEDYEL